MDFSYEADLAQRCVAILSAVMHEHLGTALKGFTEDISNEACRTIFFRVSRPAQDSELKSAFRYAIHQTFQIKFSDPSPRGVAGTIFLANQGCGCCIATRHKSREPDTYVEGIEVKIQFHFGTERKYDK